MGYAVLHGRPENPWHFLTSVYDQAKRLDGEGYTGELFQTLDSLDPRECRSIPKSRPG